jgi:hypothetical protein
MVNDSEINDGEKEENPFESTRRSTMQVGFGRSQTHHGRAKRHANRFQGTEQ